MPPERPVDISDVDSVASGLVSFGRTGLGGGRRVMRMRTGTYSLQFVDDTDNALVVTVQQFPRTAIPVTEQARVHTVEGLDVLLLGAGYAVYLELTFGVAPSSHRDVLQAAHEGALGRWVEGDHGADLPEGPINGFAAQPLVINDDVGTQYSFVSGVYGGTGSEWVNERNFLPPPPPEASMLFLTFPASNTDVGVINLPLPS